MTKDYKVILGCLCMEVINVLYDKGINRIKDKTTWSSRCDHNQGLWPLF